MSRKKIIAGNWKMYKNSAETKEFLSAVATRASEFSSSQLVIFAQGPLLAVIQNEWKSGGFLAWGPQSTHWETKGAFTGEISPLLAKEFGCTYALSGHSERRQYFAESNDTAAKRAVAAHANGLKPMLCIGETLAEREANQTFSVLRAQLKALFAISPTTIPTLSVAYEPVWAIGTGRTATSAQAQEAHAYIREEFKSVWGDAYASTLPILYGGSVKPENAAELLSQPDVDGALIGGASLEPASFLAIAAAGK